MDHPTESPPAPTRWLIAGSVGVALIAGLVLGALAPAEVGSKDGALFAFAGSCGGIPHPPGAPTWVLLATPWTALLRLVGVSPAHAANLFSVLFASLTLGTLPLVTAPILKRTLPELSAQALATGSFLPPLCLAAAYLHSDIATVAEQYTLLSWLLLLLVGGCLAVTDANRGEPWSGLLGLVWGLAMANHLSQAAYVFGLLGCVLWHPPRRWRRLAAFAAGTGLGLLAYGFVVLRSKSDPLLDWGDIESLDRLLWALQRREWPTRPLSEVPPDFFTAWLRSTAFPISLGPACLVMLPAGAWALWQRKRMALGIGLMIILPYFAGMALAHARQQGMTVDYVRHYGVQDFHQPLYALGAMLCGVGAAFLIDRATTRGARWFVGVALAAAIPLQAAFLSVMVLERSQRSGERTAYLRAIAPPVPNAIMVLSSDDLAFPMGYSRWVEAKHDDCWVGWGNPALGRRVAQAVSEGKGWDREQLQEYFQGVLGDPKRHPIRVGIPSKPELASSPVLLDFAGAYAPAARFLLPRGAYFELRDAPTSDAEVTQPDPAWEVFLAYAPPSSEDSESEYWDGRPWSEIAERRGDFFASRRLWSEAVEAYAVAIAWLPQRGRLRVARGEALERLGRIAEAEADYDAALSVEPSTPRLQFFLGLAAARRGDLQEAARLLEAETRRIDAHPSAVQVLKQVHADLARGSAATPPP